MTDITDLQMTVQRLAERVAALEGGDCPKCRASKFVCDEHYEPKQEGGAYHFQNEPVATASTVSTEPERPKDETELFDLPALASEFGWTETDDLAGWTRRQFVEARWHREIMGRLPKISEPAPSPASLDAIKAEATDIGGDIWHAIIARNGRNTGTAAKIDTAIRKLADDAHALGLSERVQTETDVRERATDILSSHMNDDAWVVGAAVVDLDEAGLLASAQQPQRVTLDQCAKLYLEISDTPPEKGGVHIAVDALRRAIPGIVIEEA